MAHTVLGAATAGPRPPVTPGTGSGSVVTLVTGDRVLVTRDGAAALPRADGTTPFTQTRRSGDDLYVYPEGATEALAAEPQGDLIGVAPGFWGDRQHLGVQGSFGGMTLRRDGEIIGESPYPFGVFTIPAEESTYELTLDTTKIGAPARAWNRSTNTTTTLTFRSARDEDACSQGIPLLFPWYPLPEDGLKALPAEDGQRITLTATGHAGHEPGELTRVEFAYAYDEGERWAEAWTAPRSPRS